MKTKKMMTLLTIMMVLGTGTVMGNTKSDYHGMDNKGKTEMGMMHETNMGNHDMKGKHDKHCMDEMKGHKHDKHCKCECHKKGHMDKKMNKSMDMGHGMNDMKGGHK